MTKRNRKFLRKITPFIDNVSGPSPYDETSSSPKSSLSPSPSPAVSLPSATQPDVPINVLPEVPPEVNHTVSPKMPTPKIPRKVHRKKKLKERWIVGKPKSQTPFPHRALPATRCPE